MRFCAIICAMCVWLTPTATSFYCGTFIKRLFGSPFINKTRKCGIPEYVPLPKIPPFKIPNYKIDNMNKTNAFVNNTITNETVLNNTFSLPQRRDNVEFYVEQDNWDAGEIAWDDKIRNINLCESCNCENKE